MTGKFVSVWCDNLNQSLLDDDVKGNDDSSKYVIILCSLLNNIFPKIMIVWCFVSIRLLTINCKVQNDENFRNSMKLCNDKIEQLSTMYTNLLILMKTLIVIQEKMSKFYYVSLRNCSRLKILVEWFETGGKFAFTDNGYGPLTNHNIIELSHDFKNKPAINIVTEFILSIDTVVLENLNLKIELIIKTYKIGNINPIYKNVFSKYENDNNSANFDNNDNDNDNDNVINGINNNGNLNNIIELDGDNDFYAPDSYELNDWDDVTKWFNHSSLFESAELDLLNHEFLQPF